MLSHYILLLSSTSIFIITIYCYCLGSILYVLIILVMLVLSIVSISVFGNWLASILVILFRIFAGLLFCAVFGTILFNFSQLLCLLFGHSLLLLPVSMWKLITLHSRLQAIYKILLTNYNP